MKLYKVDIEVRETGTDDLFRWKKLPVYAENPYVASRRGREQARNRGLDLRKGPIVYLGGVAIYPVWLVDGKKKPVFSCDARKIVEARK